MNRLGSVKRLRGSFRNRSRRRKEADSPIMVLFSAASRRRLRGGGFLKGALKAGLSLALIVATTYTLSIARLSGADGKPEKQAPPATTPAMQARKKAEKKRLSGADLYATHCSRCHAERFVTERTAAQWKTIMLHMRVRANLPATQAKEILKYLQEGSGTP